MTESSTTPQDSPGAEARGGTGDAAASAVAWDQLPLTVIVPRRGWQSLGLAELWAYRELVMNLASRTVRVRYKQTVFGIAWAIVGPIFHMILFSVFFGGVAKIKAPGGIPYPLFTFAALVPWQFFAGALNQGANSLVANPGMLKKIYFHRFVLPLSSLGSAVIDFLIALGVLLVLMLAYGRIPGPQVVMLPAFVLLMILASAMVTMWLAPLNLQFRDIRHALGFAVQILLYATPIAWPLSLLDDYSGSLTAYVSVDTIKALLFLNPMTGVVEGFRWSLLGMPTQPAWMFAVSFVVAAVGTVSGAYFFRRREGVFADVV